MHPNLATAALQEALGLAPPLQMPPLQPPWPLGYPPVPGLMPPWALQTEPLLAPPELTPLAPPELPEPVAEVADAPAEGGVGVGHKFSEAAGHFEVNVFQMHSSTLRYGWDRKCMGEGRSPLW